jgi:pimeloyl-ACP methyl ester carboxylesterase
MPVASSDGVSIYYEVHGSGPPILFIHGSGGNHVAWWQQVAALRDNYTVVTMDLRGFGSSDSSMSEFDGQDFPEDVIAVLEDADLDDVLIVGQSIGASAGLKAALRQPDRVGGVVLAHSLGGIDHEELAELVKSDRAEAVKLPVLDRLMSKRFQEEEPARVFLFRQLGTFNVAKMADLRNLDVGGPSLEELESSGLFVAFLAAENDAVLSIDTVRRAHQLLPRSRLEIVPNGQHSMYWETPDLFNEAIIRLRDELSDRKVPA